MANSTHQRMEQVMSAISEGLSGSALSQRARDWLLVRYARWIGRPGERGDARTPEDAWEEYGERFLTKFREIGSAAAQTSGGGEIDQDTVQTAAKTVETSTVAPCPFCPPPDGSGI